MAQQDNGQPKSALKKFGELVAKRNGIFTVIAFVAIAVAMVITVGRTEHFF